MKKISFNFFRKIFISLVLLTQTVFFAGAQNYTADQQQGFDAFRKNALSSFEKKIQEMKQESCNHGAMKVENNGTVEKQINITNNSGSISL